MALTIANLIKINRRKYKIPCGFVMISYKYPKIRNSMCFYIIKNFKDCFRGSKNMKEDFL